MWKVYILLNRQLTSVLDQRIIMKLTVTAQCNGYVIYHYAILPAIRHAVTQEKEVSNIC